MLRLAAVLSLAVLSGCAGMMDGLARITPGARDYVLATEEQRRLEAYYYRRSLLDQRAYLRAQQVTTSNAAYAQALGEQIAAVDLLLAEAR